MVQYITSRENIRSVWDLISPIISKIRTPFCDPCYQDRRHWFSKAFFNKTGLLIPDWFGLHFQKRRKSVLAEHPDFDDDKVNRTLQEQWHQLSEEDKLKFIPMGSDVKNISGLGLLIPKSEGMWYAFLSIFVLGFRITNMHGKSTIYLIIKTEHELDYIGKLKSDTQNVVWVLRILAIDDHKISQKLAFLGYWH